MAYLRRLVDLGWTDEHLRTLWEHARTAVQNDADICIAVGSGDRVVATYWQMIKMAGPSSKRSLPPLSPEQALTWFAAYAHHRVGVWRSDSIDHLRSEWPGFEPRLALLCDAAGLSPAEAADLIAAGNLNPAGLRVLAGLRHGLRDL